MASNTYDPPPMGKASPLNASPIGHIDRSKDYAITGIAVCDLLSVAFELEEAPHLPTTQRRALAASIRQILASAALQERRGPGGDHSKAHLPKPPRMGKHATKTYGSRAQRGARTK